MSMTHDEIIAVIEHHRNGGKLECRLQGELCSWHDIEIPTWNFATHDYRKKPEILWAIYSYGVCVETAVTRLEANAFAANLVGKTTIKKFMEVPE